MANFVKLKSQIFTKKKKYINGNCKFFWAHQSYEKFNLLSLYFSYNVVFWFLKLGEMQTM